MRAGRSPKSDAAEVQSFKLQGLGGQVQARIGLILLIYPMIPLIFMYFHIGSPTTRV